MLDYCDNLHVTYLKNPKNIICDEENERNYYFNKSERINLDDFYDEVANMQIFEDITEINIPKYDKLVVIFDLDDTLLHTIMRPKRTDIYVRPGCIELLDTLTRNNVHIIIWSHGDSFYVKLCVHILDPSRKYIREIISTSTNPKTKKHDIFEKDISLINNDMSNILLIDNTVMCGIAHCDNFIKVNDYTNCSMADNELLLLGDILYYVNSHYKEHGKIGDCLKTCPNIDDEYYYYVEKNEFKKYYVISVFE